MSRSFKIQVNITKKPYDRPVHFKVDGGRFNTEKTIKFNVNSKYIFDFTLRPPHTIENVLVQHNKLIVEEQQRTDESITYRGEWVTAGMTKCKKGERQTLHLILEVTNCGEMKSELQCKFYGEHEMQHACWGSALGHIEYECTATDKSAFIDIVKEVFR